MFRKLSQFNPFTFILPERLKLPENNRPVKKNSGKAPFYRLAEKQQISTQRVN